MAVFVGRMLQKQQITIYGDGEQTRDFVYIEDVARANLLAMSRGNGIYNIGTGISTSINALFELLKQITGYEFAPSYGPAKRGEVRRSCLDYTKARHELGWFPEVSLNDGLTRTVSWRRAQH